MTNNLPKISGWIIRKIIPGKVNLTALGDYEEIYISIIEDGGKIKAILWLWIQIIKSIVPYFLNSVQGRIYMFRNYLKVAMRNIKRHRGYSFINISGLAVGLACVIVISMWVRYEFSYEDIYENKDDIFITLRKTHGRDGYGLQGPGTLAGLLKEGYPEIIDSARLFDVSNSVTRYGDKVFSLNSYWVDPSFMEIFSFPFVKGDLNTTKSNPDFIVITEETAEKFFGDEDPIGKTLQITFWRKTFSPTVTGVIRNVPPNTFLDFDYLLSFEYVSRGGMDVNDWKSVGWHTYVLLREDSDLIDVNNKIEGMIGEHNPGSNKYAELYPISDIHLYNISGNGPIKYIYIFAATGLLILIIACINFMNLSTARSLKRAREVGLRKVVGSRRMQLVIQFITESVLLTLFSLLIALILVKLCLPFVNEITGTVLNLEISLKAVSGLLLLAIMTGVISGIYPAFFLSSFKPLKVLKEIGGASSRWAATLRKSLVVVQLSISVLLIVCVSYAYQQLDYIKNADLGYQKDNILYMQIGGSFNRNYETIKQELMKNPDVLSMTITNGGFTNNSSGTGDVEWEGKKPEQSVGMGIHSVDYDYLKTFGVEMAQGRFFSEDFSTDKDEAYILNEAAVRAMGLDDPVGKSFKWTFVNTEFPGKIIGVIKDYNIQSLHSDVHPMFLKIASWWYRQVYIKVDSENLSETLYFIEAKINEIAPDYPVNFSFLDDNINQLYSTEERSGTLIAYGAFIAIFIACMGLFGLASFMAEQKTKEIGIRRVLGASVTNIVKNLVKEYMLLVIIAVMIASPVGYYIMNKFLQNYAYRVDMELWVFLAAGFLTLLIAVLTVGYQSLKAANADPVDSLRYE